MRTFLENLNGNNQSVQTRRVLQYLLQEGDRSIPAIRDYTRMSLPTATKLVNDLVEQKILRDGGKQESSGGRPANLYGVNPDLGYIVGAEILFNSFRVNLLNLHHEIIYEYENDSFDITNRDKAFDFLVETLNHIVKKQNVPEHQILGVGLGITGRVNARTGTSHSFLNFEGGLVEKLRKEWAYPVFIDNDTHLMTLGEKMFGAARDNQNAVYVNLGKGLGVGIISNGQIHVGKSGFAGEFGHIPFEQNEILCVCGKRGCLGTVVGGYPLEQAYRAAMNLTESLNYKKILRGVHTGDTVAKELIVEMSERLGQALSILVQVLNPETIILGGRFAEIGDFLQYPIKRGLSLHGLPQLVADCDIRISTLGAQSTMLGAFSLVVEQVFQ
jgi:predicted NBD/HSP70 family sugar kinase